MMTPCGMYMKPSRTGGLWDLGLADCAQPTDSKNGSASETPIPLRHVRRLISSLFFMRRRCELLFDATMSERIAGHNFANESLHMIAVFGQRFHQAIYDNLIVAFELPAERVSQQFLRDIAGEVVRSGGDDRF